MIFKFKKKGKYMGMGVKSFKVSGGSGGKRGHSGMCHWTFTAEVKAVSKKARRQETKRLTSGY